MTLKCEPYMDGYLKAYVEKVKKLKKKDWDLVIIVDGKERAGKSKFGQTLGYAIDETLDLSRITFTPTEFHQAIVSSQPGQVVIMDEAMTAFFSRAAMSKTNINLVRMLAECGQKNLIIIIILPSIFVLDSYLALHRASCLFHIYTDKNGQRGFFKFYDRRRKKQLYLFGKKGQEYKFTVPNFKGRFTNFKFQWEAAYKQKKSDSLISAFEKQNGEVEDLESIFVKLNETIGNRENTFKVMRDMGMKFNNQIARRWGREEE